MDGVAQRWEALTELLGCGHLRLPCRSVTTTTRWFDRGSRQGEQARVGVGDAILVWPSVTASVSAVGDPRRGSGQGSRAPQPRAMRGFGCPRTRLPGHL